MLSPSFFSLFITGLLIFCIVIIFALNFNKFYRLNYYQQITLLSFITLAIGIHGLIHLGLEVNYGFNPLQ